MKKLLLTLLSITWLNTCIYAADINKVFHLKDAEYAELLKNKLHKYKISDNFLLGLKGELDTTKDGYYLSYVSGLLKDKTLNNWSYTENFQPKYFHILYTFTDTNGLKFSINLEGDANHEAHILIDDTKYSGPKRINELVIISIAGKFQVLINGKVVYKNIKRFSTLKEFTRKVTGNYSAFTTDISLQEIVPSK